MKQARTLRWLPVVALVAGAGCDRASDLAAPTERPRLHAAAAMECEATVAPAAVRCGQAGPTIQARDPRDAARGALAGMPLAERAAWRRAGEKPEPSLLVGPSAGRLDLRLDLLRYEATATPRVLFQFEVTNRLAVPLGTTDGVTLDADSVRLAFDGSPTFVVTGTQAPPDTVAVEDATILTLNGPTPTIALSEGTYFNDNVHDESAILRSGEHAGSVFSIRWQPGVTRVRFRLLVAAAIPDPVEGLFPPGRAWDLLAVGGNFSCATRVEGAPYCWGDNTVGALGTGTAVSADGGTAFFSNAPVSLGEDFACIVSAGRVYCSGMNASGEVGVGYAGGFVASPFGVQRPDTAIARSVSTGLSHACYVTEATPRRLLCWGNNEFGQAGQPVNSAVTAPTDVPLTTWRPDTIVAGRDFSCGLSLASGEVRCWGSNADGQLGGAVSIGTTTHVPGAVATVVADRIAAGDDFVCALIRTTGAVQCWGRGARGQLGNGGTASSNGAVSVTGVSGATAIAAGAQHACAVTGTGVRCWGDNRDAQLGTLAPELSNVPVTLPFSPAARVGVVAGATFTCAHTASGDLDCLGTSRRGEFGRGTRVATTPVLVTSGSAITAVSARHDGLCVTTAFSTGCWGASVVGRFSMLAFRDRPEGLRSSLRFVQITAGAQHACGITADSSAYCWGENVNGALGDGTTTDRLLPTQVPGGHKWVDIAAGDRFTCGVANGLLDGFEVLCWGRNTDGQVGSGTFSPQVLTPTVAIGLGAGERIAAGAAHVCNYSSVFGTNYLVCWGRNTDGQLGLGDVVSRAVPTTVTAATDYVAALAPGAAHTCFVSYEYMVGSVLRCAGRNASGQLGIGTTTPSSSYVEVTIPPPYSDNGVSALAAGRAHTCALIAQDVLCWGEGQRGQLRDAGVAQRTAPELAYSGYWYDLGFVVLASNPMSDVTCAWERAGGANPSCWGGDNRFAQVPGASVAYRWAQGEVPRP
jgi:alpha-tubulin suppressor-like RCC1 family protein